MPQAYVAKVAKENGMSIEEAEHLWETAKQQIGIEKDEKDHQKWGLVTNRFKELVKERNARKRKK